MGAPVPLRVICSPHRPPMYSSLREQREGLLPVCQARHAHSRTRSYLPAEAGRGHTGPPPLASINLHVREASQATHKLMSTSLPSASSPTAMRPAMAS